MLAGGYGAHMRLPDAAFFGAHSSKNFNALRLIQHNIAPITAMNADTARHVVARCAQQTGEESMRRTL